MVAFPAGHTGVAALALLGAAVLSFGTLRLNVATIVDSRSSPTCSTNSTRTTARPLLGLVGAGGIGCYVLNASRVLEFGVVTTVLLLIFAVVVAVELLALWLRKVLAR